ncbi:MAG: DNA-binding response regulator [Rhodospirillaceae bacterium]|nr:MAG: DNA-binding response regulator [Rhodospirillaceae bacterium]
MNDGKRILIIDDTEVISEALSGHLARTENFSCDRTKDALAGVKTALAHYFDMIIVNVVGSSLDQFDICKQLRAGDVVAPIILLVADGDDATTIKALDFGATDCVSRPFKLGVLMARIRAHIRQFEHSEEAQLSIGPFYFNGSSKTLRLQNGGGGRPIHLTDKEAQILKFLYLHSDRLTNRDELLGEVWGYNAGVTTHTLETHVYRLRQKMETDPSHAKILVTEPGGYRLNLMS